MEGWYANRIVAAGWPAFLQQEVGGQRAIPFCLFFSPSMACIPSRHAFFFDLKTIERLYSTFTSVAACASSQREALGWISLSGVLSWGQSCLLGQRAQYRQRSEAV
jgi:hypothetical protein